MKTYIAVIIYPGADKDGLDDVRGISPIIRSPKGIDGVKQKATSWAKKITPPKASGNKWENLGGDKYRKPMGNYNLEIIKIG